MYLCSSLVGLVSSNRRWQRPPKAWGSPKLRQMLLAWPMCRKPLGSGGKRVTTSLCTPFSMSAATICLMKLVDAPTSPPPLPFPLPLPLPTSPPTPLTGLAAAAVGSRTAGAALCPSSSTHMFSHHRRTCGKGSRKVGEGGPPRAVNAVMSAMVSAWPTRKVRSDRWALRRDRTSPDGGRDEPILSRLKSIQLSTALAVSASVPYRPPSAATAEASLARHRATLMSVEWNDSPLGRVRATLLHAGSGSAAAQGMPNLDDRKALQCWVTLGGPAAAG
mmetsp:Transcript_38318/g.109472  ORF Transcript_38318/g.109472 Transcript_38318/m.109472 type:complete len:276 (-) Transcript_38318:120-947(-)